MKCTLEILVSYDSEPGLPAGAARFPLAITRDIITRVLEGPGLHLDPDLQYPIGQVHHHDKQKTAHSTLIHLELFTAQDPQKSAHSKFSIAGAEGEMPPNR